MAAIVLEHVCKVFAGGVKAVDDVNLEIADGEFLVLVGPSGCGKTTLLRMIAGLEDVSSGSIFIGADDVTNAVPRERDIAMVFQNYALYPHMTVRQNLAYGLRVRRTAKSEVDRRVDSVARMIGLDGLLERKPAALSGGQRQRVAMGRAIVREPSAFLMDEPLSNLDAKLRVGMRSSLAQLHERLRTTTVYVTHDQVEAMTLGERVVVMRDGIVQQVAAPQQLYREPVNLFVAAFIGSPSMNLVEATLEDDAVTFAGVRIPLAVDRRPDDLDAGTIILGIRPEAFSTSNTAELPEIEVTVAAVEEVGSHLNIIFPIDSARVEADAVDAAAEGEGDQLLVEQRAVFKALLDARTQVRPGQTLRLALDAAELHFFDPETGNSLRARQIEGHRLVGGRA